MICQARRTGASVRPRSNQAEVPVAQFPPLLTGRLVERGTPKAGVTTDITVVTGALFAIRDLVSNERTHQCQDRRYSVTHQTPSIHSRPPVT